MARKPFNSCRNLFGEPISRFTFLHKSVFTGAGISLSWLAAEKGELSVSTVFLETVSDNDNSFFYRIDFWRF